MKNKLNNSLSKTWGSLVLLLIISCSKSEFNSDIIQVKYGTSFGMCIGYCKRDIVLKSDQITYTRSGWSDTIKTITCNENLEGDIWKSINAGMDVESFFELPAMIGCPDCADGGTEWIEIELANGDSHKVIFEYHNEPKAVKGNITILRDIFGKSKDCME